MSGRKRRGPYSVTKKNPVCMLDDHVPVSVCLPADDEPGCSEVKKDRPGNVDDENLVDHTGIEPETIPVDEREKNVFMLDDHVPVSVCMPVDDEPGCSEARKDSHGNVDDENLVNDTDIEPVIWTDSDKDDPIVYKPPINDEQEDIVDQILVELQERIIEERYLELADDDDPFQVMADHMAETYVVDESASDTNLSEKLYDGSKRNLGAVILLLCCFVIRFRLSDEALNCLMCFISFLLPPGHKMLTSMYKLRSFLKHYIHAPEIRYYCAWCYTHVDKDAKICPNTFCSKDLKQPGAMAYFVQHSIVKQLQVMFKRKSFADSVRHHRFNHYAHSSKDCICDVYDGHIYKDLFNKGFLNQPNNLSFAMNTDGVPIFKSSNVSMWPVYLLVNELPLNARKLRENVVFYGVWIAAKKPIMWSFLKPLYDELSSLENGVEMEDYLGNTFLCKATLLTCTCDLPARALVCNSVQFNGKYSCTYCLQPGETYKYPSGGHCHIFPYSHADPKGPTRSKDSVEKDVNDAITKLQNGSKDYVVRGIKGPSWFLFLKHFNVTQGHVIDYMHGVCGGVMKMLLTIWFGNKYKGRKEISYFEKRNIVNSHLAKIKPTMFITRIPRSLDDMVHWKSSEYRNFLLFWGIPVLQKILNNQHFVHFCALAKAIHLLSRECISTNDLHIAEQCLLNFVEMFSDLYSRQFLTMNLHQLLHLTDCVRATGPLFSNNCFVFEDLNGYIIQHIHGTQGVDTQIINTINLIQAIPVLSDKYLGEDAEDSVVHKIIVSTCNEKQVNEKEIEKGIFQSGKVSNYNLSPEEFNAVITVHAIRYVDVVSFQKIYISKCSSYVYASSYKRMFRRDQSVVKYVADSQVHFGQVSNFVQVTHANITRSMALLHPFDCAYNRHDAVHKVIPCNEIIVAVPLCNIMASCIYVQVDEDCFVCEIPNRYDRD